MAGECELGILTICNGNSRSDLGRGLYVCRPRHHNIVSQFVATIPIRDLCLAAYRRPGVRFSQRWWEQGSLDLEGVRVASRAAEMIEMEEVGYEQG